MQPGEAAVCLRVQVAPEDAQAHGGMIVGLVGIRVGGVEDRGGGGGAAGGWGAAAAAAVRKFPAAMAPAEAR